jgi:hypothetical protein
VSGRLFIYLVLFGCVGSSLWALVPYLKEGPFAFVAAAIFGSMFAVVPMAVTGMLSSIFANRVTGIAERILFSAFIGALALPLWRGALYRVPNLEGAPWLDLTLLAWSINGAVAAACCALLVQWLERGSTKTTASETPPTPRTPNAPP